VAYTPAFCALYIEEINVKRRKIPFWRYGERAALAREMKIDQSHLSQILTRKRGVSVSRAQIMQHLCKKLFKKSVPWRDWFFNKSSSHKAFSGKKEKATNTLT